MNRASRNRTDGEVPRRLPLGRKVNPIGLASGIVRVRADADHSWGHAVISWPDGTTREGWLRTGDAMDSTVVAAEVAACLAHDDAPPAPTPRPPSDQSSPPAPGVRRTRN